MKKIKIILSVIIVVIAVIGAFTMYITRTQKISNISGFKDIYSDDNYENIRIVILDVVGMETKDSLNSEETKILLDTLKNENVKYQIFNDYWAGDKIKFRMYNDKTGKSFDFLVSPVRIMFLEGGIYITEDNIVKKIPEIIEAHKKFYY